MCLLNGTEQVTFPVNKVPSCHTVELGPMLALGSKKVSTLKLSTSKTLFDS
jgi:hypothetical protein